MIKNMLGSHRYYRIRNGTPVLYDRYRVVRHGTRMMRIDSVRSKYKRKIINRFNKNVRGKKFDKQPRSADGAEGHWQFPGLPTTLLLKNSWTTLMRNIFGNILHFLC